MLKDIPVGQLSADGNVLRFSPDNKFLASGLGNQQEVKVWNVQTGKLVCSFATDAPLSTLFFSLDGLSLLHAGLPAKGGILRHLIAEKDVCLFNVPSPLANSYWPAYFACFSPDYKRVAVLAASSEGGSFDRLEGQMSVYLFNVPAKAFDPAEANFDDAPLEKLWNDLGSDNDLRLRIVLKLFRASPKHTVELIGKKVQPVSSEFRRAIEKILANDDEGFSKSTWAGGELAHQFAPLVKTTVMQKMPAGARRDYVMAMVNRIHDGKQPVALAAALGAVKLLEELATKEARDILNRLTDGAEGARLTIAARAAVARLKSKSAPQ
jgi:hypothetical protein